MRFQSSERIIQTSSVSRNVWVHTFNLLNAMRCHLAFGFWQKGAVVEEHECDPQPVLVVGEPSRHSVLAGRIEPRLPVLKVVVRDEMATELFRCVQAHRGRG